MISKWLHRSLLFAIIILLTSLLTQMMPIVQYVNTEELPIANSDSYSFVILQSNIANAAKKGSFCEDHNGRISLYDPGEQKGYKEQNQNEHNHDKSSDEGISKSNDETKKNIEKKNYLNKNLDNVKSKSNASVNEKDLDSSSKKKSSIFDMIGY